MKNLFIISIFTCFGFMAFSQSNGSISGQLLDSGTGDPLVGVTIQILGTTQGTVSDKDGKFEIYNLTIGESLDIVFSFIGFKDLKREGVIVLSNSTIDLGKISLKESPISLKAVVVTPGRFSIMGDQPLSRQTLKSEDIKNMSFAEDITRAVVRLPGVASNDFSSKFTIRGGEDDEVLITLDGMEFYEPFHQRDFAGGLFSIIDIETIQGVDLMTGGFSAEFGNRESGVFTMQTKRPRDDEKSTSLGLSVMNARLYTDGTFGDNKWNYLVSARRGMLDQALKIIGEDESLPSYYDMMGKLEYKASDKHTFAVYGLQAGDKTAIRDVSPEAHDIHDTEYSNTYAWLTWKASFSPKIFARTLVFVGSITHDRNGDTAKDEWSDKLNFQLADKRSYSYVGLKQDWVFDVSDKFILKTGFDLRRLNADYDYAYTLLDLRVNSSGVVESFSNNANVDLKPKGEQTSAYVSGKYQIIPKLFLETGLRHDYASYSRDNLISPRASFTYSFNNRTFLRGAWGKYYQTQFINDLDVNHEITSFDPAELSTHYVLGLERSYSSGITMRIEGYYKDISRVSSNYQNLRDPWEVFPEARNDQIRIDYDGATSKGIEIFLKYDIGSKVSWWFSYAIARAEETVANIDYDGLLDIQTGTLPRINNQQHTVYLDVNYKPVKKWNFNVSWQYYQGLPQTVYDYDFQTLNGENGSVLPLHFFPRHLEFRGLEYPAYHRMDVRTNRSFELKNSRILAFVHLVNVYGRENQRKFDLDVTGEDDNLIPDGQGGYVYPRDDTTWFGFLPIIGMSWEF